MKSLLTLFFLILIGDCSFAQLNFHDLRFLNRKESSVMTEKAFIWSEPGYSWRDCRPADPKSRYSNKQDRIETKQRYEGKTKQVCEARNNTTDLLSSGDVVEVVIGRDGQPIKSAEFEIKHGDETVKESFYKVKSKSGRMGWMSDEQISEPRKMENRDAFDQIPKKEEPCPDEIKSHDANAKAEVQKNWADIKNKMDRDLPLGRFKSRTELDKFMCIYREPTDTDEFMGLLPKFNDAAHEAEKDFGIPVPILQCAMLVESGFVKGATSNKDKKEAKRAKGYAQILAGTVDEIETYSEQEPYDDMLAKYKKKYPRTAITDQKVRLQDDIPSATAAMAIYMRKIYDRDLQACRNCTRNSSMKMSRKDIDLIIAGYSAGPGIIKEIANMSSANLRTTSLLTKETRDYMIRMEKCLEQGKLTSFREDSDEIQKVNKDRQKRIESIQSRSKGKNKPPMTPFEKGEIARLKKLIEMKASPTFARRAEACDASAK
jgi:hypothetical protein